MAADGWVAALFWLWLALVVYAHVGFPVLLALVLRLLRTPVPAPRPQGDGDLPAVACVISAFNEERHVEARIRNLLTQDYPADKLRVYIGSDGSDDATPRLIQAQAGPRVHAFAFPRNRGKASVLNDLVAAASEPIVVFSDANTEFRPDAVRRLVAHFADARVGGVSGELRLLDATGDNQDSVYWRIEQFLKRGEARLGALLGANGGIYAIRRALYQPLAPDTIVDDFCVAMNVSAAGWRLAYEPQAVALEDTPADISDEYRRRVRIGIGNYQAFFRHPEYLLRTSWATRVCYLSHKVLRWFTPHLLLLALLSSAWLAPRHGLYLALMLLQLGGYGGLLVANRLRRSLRLPRPLSLLLFFFALNWAFVVAFWRYLTGQYAGNWRRTLRN